MMHFALKINEKRCILWWREGNQVLKLRLREIMFEKRWNAKQLSEATGIRWNSIDDMMENRSKRWSVENLEKVMEVLGIERVEDLIVYEKEQEG